MTDFRTQRERVGGLFVVSRLYLGDDGLPRIDLMNGHGQAEFGIPVPLLGGARGRYIYVPPTPLREDVTEASKMLGINAASILPGLSVPTRTVGADFDPEFARPSDTEDYPDRQAVDDLVIAAGGSKIVLSPDGGISLLSPEATPLRVQLPKNGQIRVSQKDAEPTETMLLGNATLALLQDLVAKVNSLEMRLTVADARISKTNSDVHYTFMGDTYAAAQSASLVLFNTVAAGGTGLMPLPDAALLSSTFAVSAVSQKDAANNDENI